MTAKGEEYPPETRAGTAAERGAHWCPWCYPGDDCGPHLAAVGGDVFRCAKCGEQIHDTAGDRWCVK